MSQRSFVLQKIVWQLFSATCKSYTVSKKLEHTDMAFLLSSDGCQGRKLQGKNFIFTRRKIDEEELLLMIA